MVMGVEAAGCPSRERRGVRASRAMASKVKFWMPESRPKLLSLQQVKRSKKQELLFARVLHPFSRTTEGLRSHCRVKPMKDADNFLTKTQ